MLFVCCFLYLMDDEYDEGDCDCGIDDVVEVFEVVFELFMLCFECCVDVDE